MPNPDDNPVLVGDEEFLPHPGLVYDNPVLVGDEELLPHPG